MDLTLIIFAALALFLSYRLFNVLGTRDGHEPDEHERPVLRPVGAGDAANDGGQAEVEQHKPAEHLPDWAEVIAESNPRLSPKEFLDGASAAYEMIVTAFAQGDLSSVRRFVADDVLESFEAAIAARRAAGHAMDVTFVGIERPEVVQTSRAGNELRAELRFRSEQVRVVTDADGNTVEGSPEKVITVVDRWIFARPVRSNDPNWTLVATQGSDTD
mgnify:FL=1